MTASECPNRPEWAMPGVAAVTPQGWCYHCSKVEGAWVECAATRSDGGAKEAVEA